MKKEHQTKKVELLSNPKYYLAITAIFRDEASYLKEWIEFHRLVGVQHFYLFNHLSKDNYLSILTPYIKEGIVSLMNLSYEPKTAENWNGFQWAVYSNITKQLKDTVEWLIIIDSDEFLYPVKDTDLKQVLQNYDNYASISINWRIFGSSNVQKTQDNELMIERLVMRDKTPDLHVKSIVKPRYVETFNNPHFAVLSPGYTQITENYETMEGPYSFSPSRNILAINHYKYRDWHFFNNTKLSRLHMIDSQINEEAKNSRIKKLIEDNQKTSSIHDDNILKIAHNLRTQMFDDTTSISLSNTLNSPQNKKIMVFINTGETYIEIDDNHSTQFLSNPNINVIRVDTEKHQCSILTETKNIINPSSNIRIFINWQKSQDKKCLLDLEASGFIFIDILKFNEECSYLTYQQDYKLSIEDISNFAEREILAVREEVFEQYRRSSSDNQECISLANNMLFNAATKGADEWVKHCLANGADVHYYDPFFQATPLYYAVYNNHSSTAALLINNGADVEAKFNGVVPPLYTASYLGYDNLVQILLHYNASKNVEVNGKSPLQVAQENGHLKVVELLLGETSDVSPDQ